MPGIARIVVPLLACAVLAALALAWVTGKRDPGEAVPLTAARPASVGSLHLQLSYALMTTAAPGAATASQYGGGTALLLASALLAAFGAASLHARRLRRMRESAPAVAAAPEVRGADLEHVEVEDAPIPLPPHGETIARLASLLAARDLEVAMLEKEIADWQDTWRLAKPRLVEQYAIIEALQAELAAGRCGIEDTHEYAGVGEDERDVSADSRFEADVDAWIETFMSPPARRA